MLVSYVHRFIYIKTIKTASTSVEAALTRFCLSPEQVGLPPPRIGKWFPTRESEYGIVGSSGNGAPPQTWWSHMSAQHIQARLPAEVWNTHYKFCCVRNPWDKVVSVYYFRHEDARNQPLDVGRVRFREWLLGGAPLSSDFARYAINGKPVVDRFIRHESIVADFAAVCQDVGVPVPDLPNLKGGLRPTDRPYTAYYDAESREHVARLFAPDIALLGYTFGG